MRLFVFLIVFNIFIVNLTSSSDRERPAKRRRIVARSVYRGAGSVLLPPPLVWSVFQDESSTVSSTLVVSSAGSGAGSGAGSNAFPIERFPDHLLSYICMYLDPKEVQEVFCVSKRMQLPSLIRSYFVAQTEGRLHLCCKGSTSILKFFPAIEIFGTSLQTLYLSRNNLGAAGATALSSALHHLPALRKLSLWCNDLGAAGATALALALHHLPALQKLNLRFNHLGDAGVIALLSALHHFPVL